MTHHPRITTIVALLSCAFAITGCGGEDGSPTDGSPKSGSPSDPGNAGGATLKFTARELIDEFKAGEEAALAKYLGKKVEIVGIVSHAGPQEFGDKRKSFIRLIPTDAVDASDHRIVIKTKTREPWFDVGLKGKATVRGTIIRMSPGPSFDEGVVVSFEGEKFTHMKPAELTVAFKADRKAFKTKYGNDDEPRPIIVTGVVKAKSKPDDRHFLHFEGADGVEVRVSTSGFSEIEIFNAIKVGDTVTVRGEYIDYFSKDEFVYLSFNDRLD